jgi:hypothetical protein
MSTIRRFRRSAASEYLRSQFGVSVQPATATHVAVLKAYDLAAAASVPDDHEWGERELKRRLLKCSDAYAADYPIISNIERQADCWQLPMPSWTRRAGGWYELGSAYGVLVVRRLVGWTVERNNEPLRWCYFGDRVIFDKLEHAKVSALACLRSR